jgi:hypothetical protein
MWPIAPQSHSIRWLVVMLTQGCTGWLALAVGDAVPDEYIDDIFSATESHKICVKKAGTLRARAQL